MSLTLSRQSASRPVLMGRHDTRTRTAEALPLTRLPVRGGSWAGSRSYQGATGSPMVKANARLHRRGTNERTNFDGTCTHDPKRHCLMPLRPRSPVRAWTHHVIGRHTPTTSPSRTRRTRRMNRGPLGVQVGGYARELCAHGGWGDGRVARGR